MTTITSIHTDTDPSALSVSASHLVTDEVFTYGNESNTTQIHIAVDEYLQGRSDEIALKLLPDIVLLNILCITGTIGNIMVIYIHLTKFKPSSTRSAILCLASFDLVVSCFSIPGEIIALRFTYNFPSNELCKFFRLGSSIVILASTLTLVVVTYDRYRRICHPMETQLTVEKARKRLLLVFVTAAISSVPAAFVYNLSHDPTEIPGVYRANCNYDRKYDKYNLPLINICLQATVFAVVFITNFTLYTLIGRRVLRQSNFWRSHKKAPKTNELKERGNPSPDVIVAGNDLEPNESECQNGGSTVMDIPSEGCPNRLITSTSQGITSRLQKIVVRILPKHENKPSNRNMKTHKTTLMLFIINIMFVVCFLPYLTLHGLGLANDPSVDSKDGLFPSAFLMRSFFVNSVTNCFIYGFCCPKFRKESKIIVMKLFCCTCCPNPTTRVPQVQSESKSTDLSVA